MRKIKLVEALLWALVLLLPLMVLLGAGEGSSQRATLLIWFLAIAPWLLLPFIWRRAVPDGVSKNSGVTMKQDTALAGEEFASMISPVVEVRRSSVAAGEVAIAEGRPKIARERLFSALEQLLLPRRLTPILEPVSAEEVRVSALPVAPAQIEAARRSSWVIPALLFIATLATTIWVGAMHQGVNLVREPSRFIVGLPYAATLLAILGVHELGHFFAARWHRVHTTLPFFIPVPMGLGTLGAFIQIKSVIKTRRALFDIGIAGPLAGLLIAVPALLLGLEKATPAEHMNGIHVGSSALLSILNALANGGEFGTAVLRLPPVAFAGWIGIFVTALNLVPIGQLDGGHIVYALLGKRWAKALSIAMVALMVVLGLTVWPGLLTWALLLAIFAGFSHAPALDELTSPGLTRWALGIVALLLFFLIVVPVPGKIAEAMLDCPYM